MKLCISVPLCCGLFEEPDRSCVVSWEAFTVPITSTQVGLRLCQPLVCRECKESDSGSEVLDGCAMVEESSKLILSGGAAKRNLVVQLY